LRHVLCCMHTQHYPACSSTSVTKTSEEPNTVPLLAARTYPPHTFSNLLFSSCVSLPLSSLDSPSPPPQAIYNIQLKLVTPVKVCDHTARLRFFKVSMKPLLFHNLILFTLFCLCTVVVHNARAVSPFGLVPYLFSEEKTGYPRLPQTILHFSIAYLPAGSAQTRFSPQCLHS